jgi:hypothetical protein
MTKMPKLRERFNKSYLIGLLMAQCLGSYIIGLILTQFLEKLRDESINDTGAWKIGIGLMTAKFKSYVMRLIMTYVTDNFGDRSYDYTSA